MWLLCLRHYAIVASIYTVATVIIEVMVTDLVTAIVTEVTVIVLASASLHCCE